MHSTNDSPAIACSLSEAALRERRALVRRSLLPYVVQQSTGDLGVFLRFANSATTRANLEEFVKLEKQCCGFLSFEISKIRSQLILHITGPAGSEEVLQMFVKESREH